jgi:F0F1-type ATP synthase assembly protein I
VVKNMAMFEARWLRDYADYFYMGLMFPSSIAVGTALGWVFDHFLSTDPWGKIAGFFFGVAAGFINFARDYKKLQGKKNEPKKSKETGYRSSNTGSGGSGGSAEL